MYSTSSIECTQEIGLDQYTKTLLGLTLITIGLLSSASNIWLVSSLFLRAELISYIHLRLLNLSIASFGRSVLAGYPFQATSALAGRWLFGDSCCKLFAFLHQFFSTSEVLSLMFLSRECYFLIQPSYSCQPRHFISSTLIAWFVSLFWSILPFFNYGRYDCDVTGISCELNWDYKTQYEFYYIVCYATFVILIPLLYIFWNVWQSILSASTKYHFPGQEKHNSIRAVLAVTSCMSLIWLPKGLLSSFRFTGIEISKSLVYISTVCTEISGLLPVLAFLCFDKRVRCTLLGYSYNEDNLRVRSCTKNRRFEGDT